MAPRRQPVALFQGCIRHVARLLDVLCQQQTHAVSADLSTAREVVIHRLPLPLQAAIGRPGREVVMYSPVAPMTACSATPATGCHR